MRLSDFTSIGRPLDFAYATNRWILIVMGLVGGGVGMLMNSPKEGLAAALSIFFAWALARELDPDRHWSAFGAAALVLTGIAVYEQSPGGMFWLLLAVRVLNRTTGLPCTPVDSLVLLALAWPSPWRLGLSAVVLGMDAVLEPRHRRQWVFAVLALVAAFVVPWQQPQPSAATLPLLLFFAPLALGCRKVTSRGDVTDTPLLPARVQAGHALALGCILVFPFGTLLPLWSAVIACGLGRLLPGRNFS